MLASFLFRQIEDFFSGFCGYHGKYLTGVSRNDEIEIEFWRLQALFLKMVFLDSLVYFDSTDLFLVSELAHFMEFFGH